LNAGAISLIGFAAILTFITWRRGAGRVEKAARFAGRQGRDLALRLPFALLAAAFIGRLVPQEYLAGAVGPASGLAGIAIASLVGGLMPGGPMVSFPIALVFWQGGAGTAQMVALLTGWSVFAMHRILAYELPIMGWRFSAVRLLSSFFLPVVAGLLAQFSIDVLEIAIAP
jgi:uncharacterized membrane protein YraQ (UPF0718 family)